MALKSRNDKKKKQKIKYFKGVLRALSNIYNGAFLKLANG